MNNPAQKQASFSNSREGTVISFNDSFATQNVFTQNPNSMKQNYNSTRNSSSSRTERTLSLPKGVEVRTERTLNLPFRVYREIPKGNSPAFFKSLILTLVIFVAGIGSVWGQVALITASNGGFESATSTFAANGWTAVGTSARTWRVGTFGAAATGTKAAYWGTATAYGGTAASAVGHFYRDIVIPSGATNVFLNYKLKYPTIDNTYDYFYVFTTTTANTPVNAVIPTTGYTQRFVNTATTYAGFTAMPQIDLSALAGTTVRLVFTFKCDGFNPNSAPAVDDISLTYVAAAACAGTPNTGSVSLSSASGCSGSAITATGTGLSTGTGITYQWQSSSDNANWANITGATSSTYSPSPTSNTYYRVRTTCSTSGITSNSSSSLYTITPCINMSNGSTTLTGNANFYDNGGPSADYTSSQSLTYTVYPASCNNVRAVFSSIATEACCDNLKIYNGNSAAAPLIGTYTTTSPGTITSTAADGSLTFVFTSDGSVVAAGWAAVLSNVAISSGPAAPTGFAGLLNPEVGSTQTYSVTAVAGATYAWSFPSGWVINSGQGTNSVSVTVGSVNGNISVTPTRCSLAGTAYTVATTIPNYRWKYVSSNLGSATWTGGEARSIDITIKNTGVATWNTTYPNNIGVRWNSTTGSLSGTPWSDYHVRNTVGSLAPGAQGTITLAMEARNSDNAPTPSLTTNLADGTYYLAFDMVSEGQCWFSNNTGTCGPGNTVFYSAIQTVSTVPTLSCSALTAFGNVCSDAASTNSFTVSGVNLSSNVNIAALSGYSYSTSAGGSYTSTLTLTPSSGSINQSVYVKFTPGTTGAFSGNIVVSSTGATTQNVAASGTGIQATTVNAGSDFALCSGQIVAMNASTNATAGTGTASSGTITASGTDQANPTGTYTFTGLPAGALINGITVNITSAGGGNCPSWYSVTTRLNGVQQGVAGCAASTSYSNLNGQAANGLVVAVRGQDNDVYADAMTITYTVTLNYSIPITYAWSPATALSATNVLNPNCSATSTTTYTLTVTGTNGCVSSDQVVATVAGGAVPSTPTAAVSGSSTINVGGTTTLTSTAGANTVWYTAATGGASIGTGSPFTTPTQCTSGSVTYYAEDNNGTCASNSRGAVSFTVRPMVVSNPSNGLICSAGGSVTLSSQLTGGSAITWSPNTNLSTTSGASTVASPTATTVYTMSATVAGCGAVSATQAVGVIDAVAFTPTSTPTAVCAGNTAALASNLASSGFTVSPITCALSTVPGAGVTTLCTGGSSVITPTSTAGLYPLDDSGWGSVPIGFTYNFFGTNYTSLNVGTNGVVQFGAYNANALADFTYTSLPNATEPLNIIALAANDNNLSVTGASSSIQYWTEGIAPTRVFVLYYNQAVQYATGPGFTTGQIKLFETTGNVETHITTSTSTNNKVVGLQNFDASIGAMPFSSTNTITNQAWRFIPGANYTFQWATAGSPIGGATSTTYTTPVLSTPGTVSYSVAATNPNTQCTTTQSVNITVNSLPAAPVSLGDVTACNTAGSQNLVVSTGAGETADWYNASTAGTLLTNNNTTYATATAGMYYAEAENTTTGCKSATRTAVTLNSNTAPSAPTASGATYCQGATATALTASAPTGSNTQSWYTVAVGGTPLAGAPTPSTASAGTTNFYVSETSGSNGCESTRTLVGVTVNATPAAPSASNPSAYCQNATASALSATSDGSSTLYWYTVPTGGTGSTTAITPSTSAAGTATYYVSQLSASNCESSRTAITVTVNPTITASVTNSASSTSACGGGAITFTATPTNGGSPSYQWYLNGAAVSGEINPTYSLATPADADAIYVEMTPSAQTCLSSSAATASNTVTLTSTASTPTVSIQSTASSAFCPGTSVTFSVNSSANMGATPTYQWNLNGTPISGANNPTLVTTTLNNNDQVTLTMTSSLNGTCLTQSDATSTSVTSLVNSSTSITSQPADASACTGSSASFTVAGAGQGTLTYQWKKNGANITGNATATTSTLTISGIAAGDAANYTVDVIGACGTAASNTASLALNAVTAISVQPVAVTACNGLTAAYNVTASGQGTLSYQWRKDGSPISGATNSSYSLSGITSTNAGNYSVVVSGGCGNITSSNAALTVQPATLISSQPSASTICQNNTANFAVTAIGQGALSYQWKLNGNAISGATGSTLAVSNAQALNAGSYTVDVTAGCGTTSSSTAALTVNPATSITTQPVGTAGCEGQNTTFTVVAAGTGTLSYQWKYGSTNVGTNSSSYNIASTSTANDGNYSVVVTGGCGNTTSNTVALNVYASPATPAVISTADITDATLCGKNELTVAASTPGAESTGEWSVVGNWGILPVSNTDPNTTFTANNAALGGSPKQLVWSHIRETSGNYCYSHDTITVEFKQPTITPIAGVIQNGDVVWGGLSSSDWSTSDNWYQYQSGALIRMTQGEPTSSTKVYTLSNSVGGTCVSSVNSPALGASESAANMYVGVGATLNLSNGSMTIAGDLTNNGTINPGSGTVTFNGSSVQKVTGTGTIANFNNVIVNKTGGTLTLEQPTKVAGTLTMTQGDIVTDNVNILEVGSSASAVGSVNWTAGTVRGPMKRWFAASTNATQASGVFPVGATIPGKGVINRYAQVNFSSAPGTGGYIIAEYKTGTPSTGYTGLPLSYGVNQYIQNYEEEGYWDITPYNASGSAYAALNTAPYTLKLRMNNPSTLQPGLPPSGSNGNAVADISKIRIITSKGPSHNTWVLAGTQGSGHSVLASGDYLLEETGVTGFSFFNGGGNDNNPLPVELVSFSGLCEEGNINLTWQTASEFNSSHFDVEKSRDGENWQMLTTVPSAGTSNELLTYQTVDQNGTDGNNYYRLRQVDIDGTEKVYDPINVSCAEVTPGYFSSFPNPSGTSFQLIVNNKELIGTCVLNMVDATGKVIEQREIEVKDGINMFVINQELTPGIYFLNISNGSKSTSVLRHAVK